jgi:hypothetical protein
VSTGPRLDLSRPRDVGALFGDALRVWGRHIGTFLAIAAAIVVPVELIVSGFGLEQLSSGYDESPPLLEALLPAGVSYLVTIPLVTATCVYALRELGEGHSPGAGRSIAAGLEAFRPIFFAVVLAAAGVALGLVALIVPGVYLAVRWYFVPQSVVLEGARLTGALEASGRLVRGSWWRVFGIVVLANVALAVPSLLLMAPFEVGARELDSEAVSLAGLIVAETLTTPLLALVATLLYFDLRSRASAVRAAGE